MSNFSDILQSIDRKKLCDIIEKEYRAQGYGHGDFAQNLECRLSDTTFQFLSSKYAYFMLHGRGAGKRPPINVIQEWCDYKGINFKSCAFLIARKIGREGTKGNDFVTPIIPELVDEIRMQLITNNGKDIRDYLTKK